MTCVSRALPVVLLAAAASFLALPVHAAGWKAGVARALITPDRPMWMAGYASRTKPAEGKLHDLWVKALALEDASGKRAVLVTLDLCGIDRDTSNRIRDRVLQSHRLGREAVVLASTHTHSGPMTGHYLRAANLLEPSRQAPIREYTAELEDKVVAAVGEALAALAPATLT
jgi:predicted neutral ceramidase superfamily lipid hydrolase